MSVGLWIWSHVSFVVLVMAILCSLIRRQHSALTRTLCCCTIVGLAILPIQQLDLSGLMLGHIGILSASTMVLLLQTLSSQLVMTERLSDSEDRMLNWGWFLVGSVIYTSTFGFIDQDFYALGYQTQMSWFVLAASAIAAVLRHWLLAMCLVTAILAHQWRLCESANLWDCLIDPWLFLASAFQLLLSAIRRISLHQTTVAQTQQIV
ncbi:MAG: hypothetical protein GY758_17770 [Fuerstiella sp.]|nr:hypothetical protein [Fuerstiella sp.]MCP4506106.1 hypothetical protein [Fuerstiella sp.]MCP4787489.1 hypothetical protein [Fuerstiella sp.]MCP4859016.1 hypothetical protein [Fuerstiella sp.]